MQPDISAGQQGRWEEKLDLEQGQRRPSTLLGKAGIPKEKWEPTSVAHYVNSDNADHLQKTSVLFPRALPCAWPGTWRSWRRRSGCYWLLLHASKDNQPITTTHTSCTDVQGANHPSTGLCHSGLPSLRQISLLANPHPELHGEGNSGKCSSSLAKLAQDKMVRW